MQLRNSFRVLCGRRNNDEVLFGVESIANLSAPVHHVVCLGAREMQLFPVVFRDPFARFPQELRGDLQHQHYTTFPLGHSPQDFTALLPVLRQIEFGVRTYLTTFNYIDFTYCTYCIIHLQIKAEIINL